MNLGVNIDHVATIREARGGAEPDPVSAALACEAAGCDSIVCHLREDRRHLPDEDRFRLRKSVKTRLNLEMSIAKEVVDIARRIKPDQATLVPEKRQELTTEGGLDVVRAEKRIRGVVETLRSSGIEMSLFIDPVKDQIDASKRTGAGIIELHTGEYSNARDPAQARSRLKALKTAVYYAGSLGLIVNAGHGLNYENTGLVVSIDKINELNIGHSIISRSVFVGLDRAVKEMLAMIKG